MTSQPYDPTGHYCWFCGREFVPRYSGFTHFCSARCHIAQWRAIKMLEGTHGWVGRNGCFARIEGRAA